MCGGEGCLDGGFSGSCLASHSDFFVLLEPRVMGAALRGCLDLFLQGGDEVKRGTMVLNGLVLTRQFFIGVFLVSLFFRLPRTFTFLPSRKGQRTVGPTTNTMFTQRFRTISSISTTVPDRYW